MTRPSAVPSTVPMSVASGAITGCRASRRGPARRRRGRSCRCRTDDPRSAPRRREVVVEDRGRRGRRGPGTGRKRSRSRSRHADDDGRRSKEQAQPLRACGARLGAGRGPVVSPRRAHSAAEPNARVEKGVEDVGDQRHDEVDEADDEHPGGQQRQVLLPRGLEDERADPLVVEEVFNGDEPAEEVADLNGDDRDRRRQGFRSTACARRRTGGKPSGGRARVVAVERLDHPARVMRAMYRRARP